MRVKIPCLNACFVTPEAWVPEFVGTTEYTIYELSIPPELTEKHVLR